MNHLKPDLLWKIAVLIFGTGIAYSQIKAIPALEEKTQANTTNIAVLQSQYGSIKEDLKDIKGMLRRR